MTNQTTKLRTALKTFRARTNFSSCYTFSDKHKEHRRLSLLGYGLNHDKYQEIRPILIEELKKNGIEYKRVEYVRNMFGGCSKIAIYLPI